MYARRIECRNQIWAGFRPSKYLTRTYCVDRGYSHSLDRRAVSGNKCSRDSLIRRHFYCRTHLDLKSNTHLRAIQLRAYSSEGDGRNASEDKHIPVKDEANFAKGKPREEADKEGIRNFDVHARLGEQDQKEWLINEKLAIDTRKKESPFLTRRDKFKNEFLRRVVPWEKITVSWESFPYYIHEHTKNLLVECATSHLRHKRFATSYGAHLTSSSGRILLQSAPGTELYRERLVRALARDLQVPLLVLDSSVLAPYDFGDDCQSEGESDDDSAVVGEEYSESEVEDENDASNEEEWTSSNEARSDGTDNDEVDVEATAEAALRKLIPCSLEEFEKEELLKHKLKMLEACLQADPSPSRE